MKLAPAATESEAGNAYGWDHALRSSEAERLGLTVELTELQSGLSASRAFGGIDANAFHRRHVNHKTAIANGLTGDAVTAAAYRDENIVFASDADTREHVSGTSAASDDGGPPINHGIRHCSGLVVTRLARTE
jgi:hypothetical protein